MYRLLHFLSYGKGKREGIPQRRPWGMVDGALTPWLIDVAHVNLAVIDVAAIDATCVNAAGHQCGCRWRGVCRRGCWGSRWLVSSCPLLCVNSPPCPTSLSHLLLVLLFLCPFNLGVRGRCWRGAVDLAGVDMATLTCPGQNRQGMVDVDMVCGVVDVVCGMWLTGSVVDVAWSTGMVMNAHIPQHEGRGKDTVALRLRVVVGGMWNWIVTQVTRVMLSHTSLN